MSDATFDFGAMVNAQMKSFRSGFKFPGSFNEFKNVEADPAKRRAQLAEAEGVQAAEEEKKSLLNDKVLAAFKAGDPVEGLVEKEVKGGYEVTVAGQRAFCPFSQIDRFRRPDAQYVGEKFLFQVSEYSEDERGVNLVVSRRAELDLEKEVLKEDLRASLEPGKTVNGQIVKVLPFGAFVDLGGYEGLVPAREISWDRVLNPKDFVSEGDYVTVKVLSVDWEQERISLSIRECQSKPLKPVKQRKGEAAPEEGVSPIDLAAEVAKVNAQGASFGLGAFDQL